MIRHHKLQALESKLNDELEYAISRHSADLLVPYKEFCGETLWLGYYLPEDYEKKEKQDAIILIHGGGWSARKIFDDQNGIWKGDYLGYLARYYAMRGFVAVSVDYRLVKKDGQEKGHGIMDAIQDCQDAVQYVVDHADDYGIDTDYMYLLGESAGGHLAGMVAVSGVLKNVKLKKAVLVNPITDLSLEKWEKIIPQDGVCNEEYGEALEEKSRFFSPLHQISENMCDILLLHGEMDTSVSPEHSKRFYQKMQEVTGGGELHLIEGTKHAFLLPEFYKHGWQACQIAIKIINENMKK